MNEVFKKEWELYTAAGSRPQFRGVEKRICPQGFDAPVKVGEVRVFADMNRPFVALVVEDRATIGYRLVPVSPFTVPASAREMLVGERVFQLWNACTAAKSFVGRSWLVEALASEDLADIVAALAKVVPGMVSVEPTARAYEREFRVSGGDFKGLTAGSARQGTAPWRRRAAWSIAAMLMICCGIGGLWYEDVLRNRRVAEARAVAAQMEAYREKLLEEMNMPCECDLTEECEAEYEAEPAASCPTVSVRPPVMDSVAYIESPFKMKSMVGSRSPIKMRSMVGSRTPGSIGCARPRVTGYVCSLPAPSFSSERYAEYAENEFVSPKSEPLSTFGLDVDTSSYALMRSSINDFKRLPPKNSVRLEEFVNYFKYDYPQPQGDDPIAVDCELAACPWKAKHRLLRLGVQAKTVEDKGLPPCNLTFLIDVSGSMEWNNGLEMAKRGLKMLVGKLRDEDHVAIVTYANGTAVRLPSVSGREKNAIRAVIDGLSAGGGTAGGAGIQLAYEEAKKNFDRKANNRVILVTDGDFNIGISSPKELEDFIAAKRESGVFLTVLGVGRGNYQDANMKRLANAGNGNYAFLDSVLEAKKVMMNEFGGTLMTVAKDVKVQVEFNPSEVEGYRLLGYENRRLQAKDFNDDRKDAGEIGSGHTMTAFYEIIPAGAGEMDAGTDPLKYQKRETAKSGELMTVKMRYKKPDGDKSVLIEKAHTAAEMTRKEPSEDFRFASAVAEFALLLEGSKFKGEASYSQLIERARKAKGEDREGYRAEFIRLAESAEAYDDVPLPEEGHDDSPREDGHAVPVVIKALGWLKLTQNEDGGWGTNGVADTALSVLAYLRHGETDCSSDFGDTVRNAAEYLVRAVERGKVTEAEMPLTAYALADFHGITGNPQAGRAVRNLLARMEVRLEGNDLFRGLMVTEAQWAARMAKLTNGTAMAQLAGMWERTAANGDEIAFKCLGLMRTTGVTNASVRAALEVMRNWKPGERDLWVESAAAECKWLAGMCANARQEDLRAWQGWNAAMKSTYPKTMLVLPDQTEDGMGMRRSAGFWKRSGFDDLQATCLIALQLMVHPGRHLLIAPPSGERPARRSEVAVEVDI